MSLSIRSRAAALALVSGAMLAVPFAAPASALTPSVSCKKVLSTSKIGPGTKLSVTATTSQCSPAALSAGGVQVINTTISKAISGNITGTMTWKGGKGTTVVTIHFVTQKAAGNCPKGMSRILITGKTGKSTGTAATIVKSGEPLTSTTCAFTSGPKVGQSILAPGTVEKL